MYIICHSCNGREEEAAAEGLDVQGSALLSVPLGFRGRKRMAGEGSTMVGENLLDSSLLRLTERNYLYLSKSHWKQLGCGNTKLFSVCTPKVQVNLYLLGLCPT